jgi:nucleoside-diphosphate-sugar epimerase
MPDGRERPRTTGARVAIRDDHRPGVDGRAPGPYPAPVGAKRIVVAGASGAIGRRLIPLLLAAGHEVTGTTRSAEAAEGLRAAGVRPAIVDVRDEATLTSVVVAARPDVVIHQLTALAGSTEGHYPDELLARTAQLRVEATPILLRAAVAAGAARMIAQSSATLYAPGPEPHPETDELAASAPWMTIVLPGVLELERQVGDEPGIEGVLLRYGLLYGPGTPTEGPAGPTTAHVDAAAWAAALAVDRGTAGVYNVVDDGPAVDNTKARTVLGWTPGFRLPAPAPAPAAPTT